MFNVAHALSPAMLAAQTMEFKELNPKPLGPPREISPPPARRSMTRAFPEWIFRLARRAMAPMPKATDHFAASPASSMITF
jgi:hypothetical protein